MLGPTSSFAEPAPGRALPDPNKFPRMYPGQLDPTPYAQFGITPPDTIMALQNDANAASAQRVRDSSLAAFTYTQALDDASEALTGIVADVYGNTSRTTLKDIFVYKNRLRGLGILLVALALAGLLIDAIVGGPR